MPNRRTDDKVEVDVLIEVQNLSAHLRYMDVSYNSTGGIDSSLVAYKLTDEKGKQAEQVPTILDYATFVGSPGWIFFPQGTTVRIPDSVGTFGVLGRRLTFALSGTFDTWFISPTQSAQYFLSGKFSRGKTPFEPEPLPLPSTMQKQAAVWNRELLLTKVVLPEEWDIFHSRADSNSKSNIAEDYAQRILGADCAKIPVSAIVGANKMAKEPITVRDHDWMARFANALGTTYLVRSSPILADSAPILFCDKSGTTILLMELLPETIRVDDLDYHLDAKTHLELSRLIKEKMPTGSF